MTDLLTLSDVHTHIGRYHILHGVDGAIDEGQTTMLLGRNYRDSFERVVGLKLRNEALAVQLRAEKAVADH